MADVVGEFEDWLRETIEHHQKKKQEAIKGKSWDDVLDHHRMAIIYISVMGHLQIIKRFGYGDNK